MEHKERYVFKNYIQLYSGVTVKYRVGDRERGLTDYYELVPYGKIEEKIY